MDPIDFFVAKTKYLKNEVVESKKIILGFSNQIYCVTTNDQKKYQLRFGMHNDIIYRDNEKAIIDVLKDNTYIYYDLKNGNSIRQWIEGRNPVPQDINHIFLKKLVQTVEKVHQADYQKKENVIILHDNFGLFKQAKAHLDPKHANKYLTLIAKNEGLKQVLSHNDTSLLNIIWNEKTEELSLIDFEWGRINNEYWDYANFIRESDLSMELAQYLTSLLPHLNWKTMQEFIYLTTNFAVQWTYNMPQTKEIIEYQDNVKRLLEKYYVMFF